MKGYLKYVEDVEGGKIVTCEYIKLAVKRFRAFLQRDDLYFNSGKVDDVIKFIRQIKHYLGKHAGKPFILEPWQEFIVANIFGFYWKETDKRVCRNVFILMSRKQGKSALAAAISLYMLIADGEASPEIVFAANSREQSKILLDISTQFSKSLDPKEKHINIYRNEIKFSPNNGKAKIVSADASKLDGMNLSFYCTDELHAAKDNSMLSVLQSSQGMREQPLGMVISTAGFNFTSPCYTMYQTSIEILREVKTDDSFFSAIFSLDDKDNWQDPNVWIKSNPNLNVTVKKEFIEGEILKAKNNPSDETAVRTKTLNQWVSSSDVWLTHDVIVKNTKKLNLTDFSGCTCIVGVDLAQISDLTSVSILIVKDDKYYFFTKYYLPYIALEQHSEKERYKNWKYTNQIIITDGNVTDYSYITEDLLRINEIVPITTVAYDAWNSVQWAIDATERGLNLQIFSQALANFSKPTKTFELLIKSGKVVIDDNEITRFCFSNVLLKFDHNENCKPVKSQNKNKIDGVISIVTALGQLLLQPKVDTEIFFF